MALRVLFLGENWFGSCARACCAALRRLGCDVTDIDAQAIFPQLRMRSSRALLRLFGRRLVQEYNALVLDTAAAFKPDVLIAFKAAHLKATTLRSLRQTGVVLYNYFPDTSPFAHDGFLAEALPEYDCVFYTKAFWTKEMLPRLKLRHSVFIPHGYDPEIHKPYELDARDIEQYSRDVVLIATHMPEKAKIAEELVARIPAIDFRIWGNGWRESCASGPLCRFIVGTRLLGVAYAKAIRAARINLALLSGPVKGCRQGDETTTRTFEIPACGGFMLHERTDEALSIFAEGREMACFGSVEELVEKIRYYLSRPAERESIAHAAHSRCVPAYSYDNRMAELLRTHLAGLANARVEAAAKA